MRRMHTNDIECVPLCLAIFLVFALCQPTAPSAKAWLYGYAACRVAHSVTYYLEIMLRPAVWGLSWLCACGALTHILVSINAL